MITRRLLRIKILQNIYSYNFSEGKTIEQTEKELFFSINKFYDLYHQMLNFIVEVKKYAEYRIDLASKKKAPTQEDLHPNKKFVENRVIRQLEHND